VPLLGVSSPAMMDSSVLLPDPEAPTMAPFPPPQGEIDIAQNRQGAGGVGDRLEHVLHRNHHIVDMKGPRVETTTL
jgi:hypothetical protein